MASQVAAAAAAVAADSTPDDKLQCWYIANSGPSEPGRGRESEEKEFGM